MSLTICLAARALFYPELGGHLWAYMNWALGLQSLGCRVRWLEVLPHAPHRESLEVNVAVLRARLRQFGLPDDIILVPADGEVLPRELPAGCAPVEEAFDADLLLNQIYGMSTDVVGRFRRSALLDIDPGLLQIWMRSNAFRVAAHDLYFTIGETVGIPGSPIPDVGVQWLHTHPCVDLNAWKTTIAVEDAPFTTLTHWYTGEWVVDGETMYLNDKRSSFLEFIELPKRVAVPLELAVGLGDGELEDRALLRTNGWRVRDSVCVAGSPEDFRKYVQASRGEFSCAKPSCMRLQNAWISDRTLCYLASGKPAVVQYTGASSFLPDAEGILRFRSIDDAARLLHSAASEYERHSRSARELAVHHFDARKVARSLLERALL